MAGRRDTLKTLGFIEETLVESAARTANGDSGEIDEHALATKLRLQLDVTAASGTSPTLDVVVEDSVDGTNWNTIGTFTQATGVTREVINVTTPFADRIRVRWTVGGTSPNFTFSVKSHAASE